MNFSSVESMFKFIQVKVKAFFFLLQYLNLAVIYYWKNLIIDVRQGSKYTSSSRHLSAQSWQ